MFLGFRQDKKAKDVVREVPKTVAVIEEQENDPIEMISGDPKPKMIKSKKSAIKRKSKPQ